MLTVTDRTTPSDAVQCSYWSAEQVAAIAGHVTVECPVIGADDARPILPALTLWDVWPVQLDDGQLAEVQGGTLWIILSAPRRDDPNLRHDEARMRLLHRVGAQWHDCGDLLPDGFSPGSREWSGSTRLNPATGAVTLWFTAAGRRGADGSSFEQRLFQASGHLDMSGDVPRISAWTDLVPSVVNDGTHYADLSVNQGVPGLIKGFRDPYWFRDPADGRGYLLFTASKSASASGSSHDGVIGIASQNEPSASEPFTLLPHLIDADGVANELELPHVIVRNELYYLFWSTQKHVFAPGGPAGPTGLYGMVAPSLFGPYAPLNDTGLVLANPAAEPFQAYAWKVLPSLDVISFVNFWGLEGRDPTGDLALQAAHFGGTIAPMVKIELDGATARIVAPPV